MSGRPKIPVVLYNANWQLIKKYNCQAEFTNEFYGKNNGYPLWQRHEDIHFVKNKIGYLLRWNFPLWKAKITVNEIESKYRDWGENIEMKVIYAGMRTRCYNENSDSYKNYGGRGIKISKEWLRDHNLFISDMGPRPSKNHSVERKDNNGNYCKENCIWGTREMQSNNRRDTVRINFDGDLITISDLCKRTGVIRQTIANQIKKGKSAKSIIDHFNKPTWKNKVRLSKLIN